MMIKTALRTFATTLVVSHLFAASPAAHAQPALDSPLRIVVPAPPGGPTDKVARMIGERLGHELGVPVIVDNKTGASGRLAAQFVKATPAGQNVILMGHPGMMVVAPLVYTDKENGYDADKDFIPLSHVSDHQFALVVPQSSDSKDFSQHLAWMRANPKKVNIGVPATGSLLHFFALMMAEKAGVKTEVIGYRGSAPLLADMASAQLPMAIDNFEGALPLYEAGKIRILAMSGAKRSEFAPQIPTFEEVGLGLSATAWDVLFAPASMPEKKVKLLANAIQEVMKSPETAKLFHDAKATPVTSTQAQTAAMLKAFRAQWTPVIRNSGYQP